MKESHIYELIKGGFKSEDNTGEFFIANINIPNHYTVVSNKQTGWSKNFI